MEFTHFKKSKKYKFSKDIKIELNTLIELDNWHGVLFLLYDYMVISASIILYFWNDYFYLLSIIIIGSRQRALATLLHEAAHSRLCKNKTLNYIIGTYLSGYLIFQEYYTFVDSHIKKHHLHLGESDSDPDYSFYIEKGLFNYTDRNNFIKRFIIKPLLLFDTVNYVKYILINRMPNFIKYKKQAILMYIYLLALLCLFTYLGCLKYVVMLWIVPLLTTFSVIGWFIEFSEHYPMVGENDVDLYMTRNRFSHFLEGFLCSIHYENYHLVHHLHPGIPCWNLKHAHQILLQDKEYERVNREMGGIFFSSGKQSSFIEIVTNKKRVLFDTV